MNYEAHRYYSQWQKSNIRILFVEEATTTLSSTDKGCLIDARRRQHTRTTMASEDKGRDTTEEHEQIATVGRTTTSTTAKSNSRQGISQMSTTKAMLGMNTIGEGSDNGIIWCVDGGGQSAVRNKNTQYYNGLVTDLKSAQADSDAYLSEVIEEEEEKKAGAAKPVNNVKCF